MGGLPGRGELVVVDENPSRKPVAHPFILSFARRPNPTLRGTKPDLPEGMVWAGGPRGQYWRQPAGASGGADDGGGGRPAGRPGAPSGPWTERNGGLSTHAGCRSVAPRPGTGLPGFPGFRHPGGSRKPFSPPAKSAFVPPAGAALSGDALFSGCGQLTDRVLVAPRDRLDHQALYGV